jgi:hypothetical protein
MLQVQQMNLILFPNKNFLVCIFGHFGRKFRTQTSDNMTDGTAEVGRVREEKGSGKRRCSCTER